MSDLNIIAVCYTVFTPAGKREAKTVFQVRGFNNRYVRDLTVDEVLEFLRAHNIEAE